MRFRFLPILLLAGAILASGPLRAAPVTAPRDHFGFAIGDDFQLATFTQTEAYFKKIAAESGRVKLVDIGPTEEGRRQWMLIVSDPANLGQLARYQKISQQLARAEGIDEAAARTLAAEGKAVVWIDGGLHASETVGIHQLIETLWQFASGEDPETRRILRDVIILFVHANPDGQELVSNWYLREPVPARRELTPSPRLYHKYIGHDNNRDFFLSAMRETTNMNRQLYLEWHPQIVYNHHQPGPAGTIIFIPPYRDPFNYVYDPLVVNGIEAVGHAIQQRFLRENKPGATSRSGSTYSTWWNGGLRTTAYFHNQIGLLTEIVGSPTPIQIPFLAKTQLPSNDLPLPVAPQTWHFRQSIDYSVSANRAVLEYAARNREALLLDIYHMGRNSIERGSRDHWTPRPKRIEEIKRLAAAAKSGTDAAEQDDDDWDYPAGGAGRMPRKYFDELHRPDWRDPRGFILPADQPDFPTAVKFINSLIKGGVVVHRATAAFTVAGKNYPAGSLIVKTSQAFRPHILDLFEPQDHPHDFRYEGGPPVKPYDVAGWTLAFQMGVKFDRVLDGFEGPFERLPLGELQRPLVRPVAGRGPHFLVSGRQNDSFRLVNRVLRQGGQVYRQPADGAEPVFYIPASAATDAVIENASVELGLSVQRVETRPAAKGMPLRLPRVALWDQFGGSIPSGWHRWLLEQFEFPCTVIYPAEIDAGKLHERYDAIILVSGAVPAIGAKPRAIVTPKNVPAEFVPWIGALTREKSVPALKEFLEHGGTVIASGTSTDLASHLGLPVKSALLERTPDGKEKKIPEEKLFLPGSILRARVDPTHPLAWGLEDHVDVYCERAIAFQRPAAPNDNTVQPVAWFDQGNPLRSGWIWGDRYLQGGVSIVSVAVGTGRLHLFGSEVAFRGQTHGTFKFLFNALLLSAAPAPSP